jgi:signal transduction histidine kinase
VRSIRWKLTLTYFLLAAITLAMTGGLLFVTTRFFAREVETNSLRETAGDLLPRIQSVLQSEQDPARIDDFIRLAESLGNVDLRFVGPDGEVDPVTLFTDRMRRDFPGDSAMVRPRGAPMHPGLGGMIDRFIVEDAGRMLDGTIQNTPVGTIRLSFGDARQNSYLEIAHREDLSSQLTRLILLGFLVSAIVTLGASTLIGFVVGSSLTKPIVQLTRAVDTVHDGNMDARASVTTRDEIGTLGRRFNEMADRLSSTIASLRDERDSLREFMADASHELRTPLTAMNTFVELLQKEGVAESQVDLLTEMHTQTQRMERTVADLLMLSRLDGGIAGLTKQPVSSAAVVNQAWENIAKSIPDLTAAFVMTDETDPGKTLTGDSKKLVTLFENLFANSLNSLGASGTIECRISDTESTRIFRIIDDGGGIPAADLPHVFERFFRSQNNRAEGTGLGLSIAQSIVRAHDGLIEARSPADDRTGGSEIRVELPL